MTGRGKKAAATAVVGTVGLVAALLIGPVLSMGTADPVPQPDPTEKTPPVMERTEAKDVFLTPELSLEPHGGKAVSPLPREEEPPADPNNYTFKTSKGFKGEVKDGVTYIEGYLIANKTYALPADYGSGLTDQTLSAFYTMSAAAKDDGLNIYISSGFRSYSTQKGLYSRYVDRDGVEKADTYSARAGHSEHQSGLAFDVNIISDAFIGTPEAIWLADNCYKYGFILRYPQGKSDETGYKYEPWHFRYVGTELAEILYDGGNWITMEDYFGVTSQYQE